MKSEKIEALLEKIKEYRDDDPNFMKIYREYKIDHTTEESKEEVLTSLIEYMDDEYFIQPTFQDSMEEGDLMMGGDSSF